MLHNSLILESSERKSREFCDFRLSTSSSGWIVVHPLIAQRMQECGLWTADDYLQLPGVIVSGHPDRHVRRVHLPSFGQAYLKRQHYVTLKERFRNWWQGHGWVSRSVREGRMLQLISQFTQNVPQWLAFGENNRNQAFLLVASLDDAVDLHHWLRRNEGQNLRDLARRIGEVIARFHNYGFTLPDLTAKHIFVKARSHQIVVVDWASSSRRVFVPLRDRINNLAHLHASISYESVGVRERLALLSSALATYRRQRTCRWNLPDLARRIDRLSQHRSARSSLRDQRQSQEKTPEFIWLAQEAVCVTTEAARWWPHPPMAPPFYDENHDDIPWLLPNGETGYLIRGCSRLTLKGLWNCWRGYPLSTPAQYWARLLVHLQRRGVPAIRLLAFGHRPRSWHSVEWFVLCAPYSLPCSFDDDRLLIDLGRLLRRLHDASCLLTPSAIHNAFGIYDGQLYIRQIKYIFYRKKIGKCKTINNLHRILKYLPFSVHKLIKYGYDKWKD
jgi:tRNA A-37 threonylcarbamoyl transferase component Bud32